MPSLPAVDGTSAPPSRKALAEAGAAVAVNYHGSKAEAEAVVAEIQKAGGKAKAYQADISDAGVVKQHGRERQGRLRRARHPRQQRRPGVPQALQRKHARKTGASRSIPASTARSIAAIAPVRCWRPRAAGRIISIMGDSSRVGESGLALAAAARAGTIALMKSLAREWGRSGVTANSISLGLIETAHDKTWVEANREKLVKAYPIRRLGQPSDVAPMVALLASDAGSWITGQVISISGGFSMV